MEKKRIAPYVARGTKGDQFIWGGGTLQKSVPAGPLAKALDAAIQAWKRPQTSQALVHELISQGHTQEIAQEAVSALDRPGYVIDADIELQDRYSRPQLYYNLRGANPAQVQQRISAATVAVVGCGGIGNMVSAALAGSGVGTLVLADYDTIETSNLSRQIMFRESDVGQNKVTVLARELRNLNSLTTVRELADFRIESPESFAALGEVDVIVLSADSPARIVFWCNEYCLPRGIPFINVGYINDLPVVGPFVIPGVTGCWKCSNPAAKVGDEATAPNFARTPSHAWTNMVSAGIAVDDVLSYVGGYAEPSTLNRRLGLYKTDLTIQTQEMSTCTCLL
ncbi:molybdenum cofactor biosynthesis protein MoeB1 [Mycobacteroides abscessus subsp. abscessus]|uniref:ThiF family adenylyltransferase n=1 Tax=Mycobacteroides abscessus TaxID=36809 RepID=UPI00092A2F11|nr:ThiF family adenylyltransferase [Mycobacteroides abscessus]SIH38993.1 molybdenum cofactor biosynthesis protein MoeB1 [Mycobacteroides abscessus subsp. abscessus]